MTNTLQNWLTLIVWLSSWFHVPLQVQWTVPDNVPHGGYFADDYAVVEPDTRVAIDVLANDELFGYSSPTELAHVARLSVTSPPQGGHVTVQDQRFWYTAGDDFRGWDRFEYCVEAPGVLGRGSVIVQVLPPDSAAEAGLVWRKGETLQLNMKELIPALRRFAPRIIAVDCSAPQLRFQTCGSRLIIEVVDDLPADRAAGSDVEIVNVSISDSRQIHYSRSIRLVVLDPAAGVQPSAPREPHFATGGKAAVATVALSPTAPSLVSAFGTANLAAPTRTTSMPAESATGFKTGLDAASQVAALRISQRAAVAGN